MACRCPQNQENTSRPLCTSKHAACSRRPEQHTHVLPLMGVSTRLHALAKRLSGILCRSTKLHDIAHIEEAYLQHLASVSNNMYNNIWCYRKSGAPTARHVSAKSSITFSSVSSHYLHLSSHHFDLSVSHQKKAQHSGDWGTHAEVNNKLKI